MKRLLKKMFEGPISITVIRLFSVLMMFISTYLSISRSQKWAALDFLFLAVFLIASGLQEKIKTEKVASLIISLFAAALFILFAMMVLAQGVNPQGH